jgi:hypothetical protein
MYNKKLLLSILKSAAEKKEPKLSAKDLEDSNSFMKKGGSLTANLQGTNRLFKKNSLFKKNPLLKKNPLFKKKNYKSKTYSPNAKLYAEGGEPCPDGMVFNEITKNCITLDEHQKFLVDWYENRKMPDPLDQENFQKVQPEILSRVNNFPPYVLSEDLDEGTAGYYDDEEKIIALNKFLPETIQEGSKVHENNHYLTSGAKTIKNFAGPHGYIVEQNIRKPKEINTGNPEWDKNLKNNYEDIVLPDEIQSRLMTFRKLAGFKADQVITEKDVEDYFKSNGDKLDPDIQDIKQITKDTKAVVNLLNGIVSAPVKSKDLQFAENGGITTQEEIDAANTVMMKARLAYANEFGNPAAKRMINLPDEPYQFDNGDTGTHYMASMDNYAVPQIQDENGVLQLGDYGPESNEAIRFDSDEDANYFAEHYKDVSPGFINEKKEGGLHKFVGGGEPCPEGYVRYKGRCIEWQEPNVIETDEKTGYNAATGEIKQDTRPGSIENNGWWTGHEKFHHLQNLAGDMSTAGFLGQRPNNTVVSDQAMGDYYNKRKTELEAETDAMIKADPNLQFIPRNKLQESTEGFVGANDLIYSKPGVEGDARKYEEYIKGGGESIFPQNKHGGLHKFVEGGQPCPPGYEKDYLGINCIPMTVPEQVNDEDWYKNWYANRTIQDKEGQELLETARPKILKRTENFPEIIRYSDPFSPDLGSFEPQTGKITLNDASLKNNPFRKNEVLFHEKGHYLTSPSLVDPETDTPEKVDAHPIQQLRNYEAGVVEEALKPRKDVPRKDRKYYDYLKGKGKNKKYTEEISKMLMGARRLGEFQPDQEITDEDIENLYKKAEEKGWLDPSSDFFSEPLYNLKEYTKGREQIKMLFNKLAENKSDKSDQYETQIAEYGGALDKFVGGGKPCPKGMGWSIKDNKCIKLINFTDIKNRVDNITYKPLTKLEDALDDRYKKGPKNSFSDFGKLSTEEKIKLKADNLAYQAQVDAEAARQAAVAAGDSDYFDINTNPSGCYYGFYWNGTNCVPITYDVGNDFLSNTITGVNAKIAAVEKQGMVYQHVADQLKPLYEKKAKIVESDKKYYQQIEKEKLAKEKLLEQERKAKMNPNAYYSETIQEVARNSGGLKTQQEWDRIAEAQTLYHQKRMFITDDYLYTHRDALVHEAARSIQNSSPNLTYEQALAKAEQDEALLYSLAEKHTPTEGSHVDNLAKKLDFYDYKNSRNDQIKSIDPNDPTHISFEDPGTVGGYLDHVKNIVKNPLDATGYAFSDKTMPFNYGAYEEMKEKTGYRDDNDDNVVLQGLNLASWFHPVGLYGQGIKMIEPTEKSIENLYNNPTWENAGTAAFDIGMTGLTFLGAKNPLKFLAEENAAANAAREAEVYDFGSRLNKFNRETYTGPQYYSEQPIQNSFLLGPSATPGSASTLKPGPLLLPIGIANEVRATAGSRIGSTPLLNEGAIGFNPRIEIEGATVYNQLLEQKRLKDIAEVSSSSVDNASESLIRFKNQFESGSIQKIVGGGGARNKGIYEIDGKIVKLTGSGKGVGNAEELKRLSERVKDMPNVHVPQQTIKLNTLNEKSLNASIMTKAPGKEAGKLTSVEIENIPKQHWDKFEKDTRLLSERGIKTDFTNKNNLFYDKESGFHFIDIGGASVDGSSTGKFFMKNGVEYYVPFEKYKGLPKEFSKERPFTGGKDMFKNISSVDEVKLVANPKRSQELNSEAFSIYKGDKIVGEISGTRSSNGDFEVLDVGVDAQFQKQGIGTEVYKQLNESLAPGNKVKSWGAFVEEAGVAPGRNTWQSLEKQGLAKLNEKGIYEMLPKESLSSPNAANNAQEIQKLFNTTSELSKLGTIEDYTQHLDEIFPTAGIKNLMYHQTFAKKFDAFKESPMGANYFSFFDVPTGGIFSPLVRKLGSNKVLAKVNVSNPFIINKNNYSAVKKATGLSTQSVNKLKKSFDLSKNDAVLGFPNPRFDKGELDNFPQINFIDGRRGDLIELAVMDPKNTHILGSKPDIELFKKFMDKKLQGSPNASSVAEPFEIAKKRILNSSNNFNRIIKTNKTASTEPAYVQQEFAFPVETPIVPKPIGTRLQLNPTVPKIEVPKLSAKLTNEQKIMKGMEQASLTGEQTSLASEQANALKASAEIPKTYPIINPDYFTYILSKSNVSKANRKFYTEIIDTVKAQGNVASEAQKNMLERIRSGNFNYNSNVDKLNAGNLNAGNINAGSYADKLREGNKFLKNPLTEREIEMYVYFRELDRFDKLPKTTNKTSLEVLENFKKRIKTSEGKKRMKALGIKNDKQLQKIEIVEDPNSYGYYRPSENKIAINPNLPIPEIVRHEIEHGVGNAVQRQARINQRKLIPFLKQIFTDPFDKKGVLDKIERGITEIDDLLSGLELRKEVTPNKIWKSNVINEKPVDTNLFDPAIADKQLATDYFATGSEGREKATFLAEVQEYMMKTGRIPKTSYVEITPEMVKQTMVDAMFDEVGRGKYLRLFNIMNPTAANYKLVAKGLNKMLGIAPLIGVGVGLGFGAASQVPEKKHGGLHEFVEGGETPSSVWRQYTGTSWSEAKKQGLTDGSAKANLALRDRLLAGEFGEAKMSNEEVAARSDAYKNMVGRMISRGATLEELVARRIGTKEGLTNMFSELSTPVKEDLSKYAAQIKPKGIPLPIVFPKQIEKKIETIVKEDLKKYAATIAPKGIPLPKVFPKQIEKSKPLTTLNDAFDLKFKKFAPLKSFSNFGKDKPIVVSKIKKETPVAPTNDVASWIKNEQRPGPNIFKQSIAPVVPKVKTKSNFEKDLLNRLTTIAKQKALWKPEPISKVEPIPNSMAAQFIRQDFNKKYYDANGKEIKPILWDPDHTSGSDPNYKVRLEKEKARLAAEKAFIPVFDNSIGNQLVEQELYGRQKQDNERYGKFMKRGKDIANRTDVQRNIDSEQFFADIAKPNSVIIDIGSALGNSNSKLAGVSVWELTQNPKIKQKKIKVIATDLPDQVESFKEHIKNKKAYNIDYAEVPMTFNTPIYDVLKTKNLGSTKDVYLRAANSIDLLMTVAQTKEHFYNIAKSLKDKNVTYAYNNMIWYKSANSTSWSKIGNINNAAFDHNSASWKTNKNRKPYTLIPKQ